MTISVVSFQTAADIRSLSVSAQSVRVAPGIIARRLGALVNIYRTNTGIEFGQHE